MHSTSPSTSPLLFARKSTMLRSAFEGMLPVRRSQRSFFVSFFWSPLRGILPRLPLSLPMLALVARSAADGGALCWQRGGGKINGNTSRTLPGLRHVLCYLLTYLLCATEQLFTPNLVHSPILSRLIVLLPVLHLTHRLY